MLKYRWFPALVAGLLCLPGTSWAEQVRFRYIPIDSCGNTRQIAIGRDGAMGEKITGIGLLPKPFPNNFKPTHMVTFRHPVSGKNIIVPVTLPVGAARMEYRSDRIIYYFDEYIVEARFLQDGSAEVGYNSGFLRPLPMR